MAQTSAAATSSSLMPGSAGMFSRSAPDAPTPGSRSGRWPAAAPAAHSASRREMPKQPSTPAVASASACEVEKIGVGAVGFSFLDDPLGEFVTDVADRAQAQPHLGAGVLQGGVRQAGVDVRAVHGDTVPAGVGHQRLR